MFTALLLSSERKKANVSISSLDRKENISIKSSTTAHPEPSRYSLFVIQFPPPTQFKYARAYIINCNNANEILTKNLKYLQTSHGDNYYVTGWGGKLVGTRKAQGFFKATYLKVKSISEQNSNNNKK